MSKRKLLLADDSVTIQKVVNLTFADEGIEVVTVGNGSAAIEKLNEIAPDLVLADVHMPGLTGYEVCEKIRQTASYENIPVMLLVGSFEPFDEVEARRVGANDYLTKPFQSIRQLVQKVTGLLDSADSNNSPATSAVNAEQQRSTNLGDDEMIETISASNFDPSSNNLFVSPPSEESSSRPIDNDFRMTSQETANENFDMRPTAPLSYSDIEEINSFPSTNSFAPENEFVVAAEEQNQQEDQIGNYQAAEFAESNQYREPEQDIFELDLTAPLEESPVTSNDTHNFEDFGQFESNGQSANGFKTESFELDQTNSFQVTNQTNAAEADIQNVSSQSGVEFSDGPLLELDTSDSVSFGSQDEDSILDLELESEGQASDLTVESASDFQSDTFANVENYLTPAAPADAFEMPIQTGQPVLEQSSVASNADKMIAQTNDQTVANINLQYSPELIDAIAQRVIEKLSDEVIERIAWEIVPDKFDSLMKQYIESRGR